MIKLYTPSNNMNTMTEGRNQRNNNTSILMKKMMNLAIISSLASIYTSSAFITPIPTSYRTPQHLHSYTAPKDTQEVGETVGSTYASLSPAEYENSKFECDSSVEYWQNFQRLGLSNASENIREIVNVVNRFSNKGNDAVNYWLRHNARSGYFFTNAILGTLASNIHETLHSNDIPENGFTKSLIRSDVITRLVLEAALAYEQDYERISNQKYNLPYDMYQWSKQLSPFFALQQTGLFVREAVGTLKRRNRASEEDKKIWITNDSTSNFYPDYYRNAFHYQTDGWMSFDSANVYDTSTETLFLGRQDAMQRTALVPVVEYAKELGRPLKVLEVGCGTGRFMTFVRDNLPLDSEYTAIDLSPYYLDKAREYDFEWRLLRKRVERGKGNAIDDIKAATFAQAQAENLPFEDEQFDLVICVYLFHELPRNIRAAAASEMARVTKGGGRVVLCDSTQIGDRPIFDEQIGNFQNFNEPYYGDYIEDYLPNHFENAGMKCMKKIVCSASKSLSFIK